MTARAAKPENERTPVDEAELSRILRPIDEDDPEWQAYVRKEIGEALDDARRAAPAGEVFARLDGRIAAYKAKRGLEVRFSPDAEEDLFDIYVYVVLNGGVEHADGLDRRLRATCLKLADFAPPRNAARQARVELAEHPL